MKAVFALLVVVLVSASPALAQRTADPAEAAFQEAIARYLELHDRLKTEVPALTVTTDPKELVRASDTLATALQRARRDAQRGDIFNPEISKLIAARLREMLAGTDVSAFLVTISDEPTRSDRPAVHKRYPMSSSMATTPTRVLDVLPVLPDALEYRFVGRALILRDRDAAMIVDYIVDVLPAR
jgi:hypothetical protein